MLGIWPLIVFKYNWRSESFRQPASQSVFLNLSSTLERLRLVDELFCLGIFFFYGVTGYETGSFTPRTAVLGWDPVWPRPKRKKGEKKVKTKAKQRVVG